jgi:hypothetical protein
MPLSEHEREILDEIERRFVEDGVAATPSHRLRRSRILTFVARPAIALIGVLIGLACGALGLAIAGAAGVTLAVFGFALIVITCMAVIGVRRRPRA